MNSQKGFVGAFKDFWFRAGDFRGSSTRGQYWWIVLLNFLIALVTVGAIWLAIYIFSFGTHEIGPGLPMQLFGGTVGVIVVGLVAWFFYQGMPNLSLTIRRYRDAGVSPWLLLVTWLAPIVIMLIAGNNLIGWIIVLVLGTIDLVVKLLPTRHPVPLWSTRPNEPSRKVGMGGALADFFRRAGIFSGRSSRSQYWWVCLLSILISIVIMVVTMAIVPMIIFLGVQGASGAVGDVPNLTRYFLVLGLLIGLGSLITLPELTLLLRRFRDAGVSPWWYGALWVMNVIVTLIIASDKAIVFAWIVRIVLWLVEVVITVLPTKKSGRDV